MHNNTSLTGVQKLSYLRSQLQGEAARIIAGFQLTNANYQHSIDLLKERFGQPHKQIEAHMQALIDIHSPSGTVASLREFHDTIEGHIRSLASLGKSQDTYSSMLVTIILGKIPPKIKQNLARAHGRQEWKIDELQEAILTEIYILEAGSSSQTDAHNCTLPPTALFHAAATNKSIGGARGKPQCPFCKGPHSPSVCDVIKDPKQRSAVVRQEKLCFNCLGHHKVSYCNSKHRCHNCRRKHHTSLCSYEPQPTGQHAKSSTGHSSQPTHVGQHHTGAVSGYPIPPANNTQPQICNLPPTNPVSSNTTDTTSLSMTLPPSCTTLNRVCLLKTAIATVSHGNRSTVANLLFDEGSQRSFITESVGVSMSDLSAEEDMLQHYIALCITRDLDEAYVARFPWQPNPPTLPNNLIIAQNRTRQMIKRLAKTPNLLMVYNSIIVEQEARGFIERVKSTDNESSIHYIPHHAVEKDSPTTPIWIVFYCSCWQSSGYPCLNDCLLIGSPCVSNICSILIRFRSHRFGVSTDIEKAFLHVRLHPDDRDYTRFFWVTDPTDVSSQFCIYRFNVVPFGATSSPFMLNAVLHYHLQQQNTAVSDDMRSNLYVDNVITGGATEQAVISYYREARAIMSSANMNLHCDSWSSNSTELMTIAAQDNVSDDSQSVNILDLRWNPTTDKLSLAAKSTILAHDHLVTKREVLQDLSKIFDPLGLAAPVVIRAKILMQKLWIRKVAWDEPLDEEIHKEWIDVASDLKSVTELSVIRRYFSSAFVQPVLHSFADPSLKAYGAVVFLTQGDEVSFIVAKSHVAPLKELTLPRLELMAALVATRLTHFVVKAIPLKDPSIFVWSDSQIVLHWVNSRKQLPTFVHHRITEIQSLLPTAEWKYCPPWRIQQTCLQGESPQRH